MDLTTKSTSLDPLLKWPGGKRWLVSQLKTHLPPTYSRYIEPFAGGAAMFFALRPTAALLSDVNPDVINTYLAVASNPENIISGLQKLNNSKEDYYRIRDWRPESEIEKAIRILFLMRFSFNGIYRVNLKGTFNVPYGHKSEMSVCDAEHLRRCSAALASADLKIADFRETLALAKDKDLVYIDPPYTVAHNNNGFLKYNERIFSWQDQKDLAQFAREAACRGATVFISNADHADIHLLYPDFERKTISRYTSVSGRSGGRKHVTESLYMGISK